MKKTAYILFTALAFSACNYLDIEPVGQVIPHKTSEYRALMTEAYFRFPYTNSKTYTGMLSDEVGKLNNDLLFTDYATSLPYNYRWEYGRNLFELPYQMYYRAIFVADAIIADVLSADSDSSESNEQILAEAYALRAYAFFDLVNLYGAPYNPATAATDRTVPLSTHIDIEQKYKPSTVAAVYAQILADIESAATNMVVEKQTDNTLNYRFSKKALAAFKARVMLYMGNWQAAYDTAVSLFNAYPLVDLNGLSDTKKLPWKATSDETIFALERPFSGGGGDLVAASALSEKILALFGEGRDNRRSYIIEATKTDPMTGEKAPLGYYIVNRSISDRTSIRIAEMYLIAAEAGAHLDGKLSEAKNHLLSLQAKRLKPAAMDAQRAQVSGMTAKEFLSELADERARELIQEGHRWFDLRRTTRPAIQHTFNGSNYTLPAGDTRYTLPFPQSAIDANPELNN